MMMKHRRHLREILCFGLVGVAATVVHYLVALLAVEVVHANVYVGYLAGYVCALTASYFGHGKLTFKAELGPLVLRRFIMVSISTFCISELLLAALEHGLEIPHRLALALVVCSVPALSFVMNKFWVYSTPAGHIR